MVTGVSRLTVRVVELLTRSGSSVVVIRQPRTDTDGAAALLPAGTTVVDESAGIEDALPRRGTSRL